MVEEEKQAEVDRQQAASRAVGRAWVNNKIGIFCPLFLLPFSPPHVANFLFFISFFEDI